MEDSSLKPRAAVEDIDTVGGSAIGTSVTQKRPGGMTGLKTLLGITIHTEKKAGGVDSGSSECKGTSSKQVDDSQAQAYTN